MHSTGCTINGSGLHQKATGRTAGGASVQKAGPMLPAAKEPCCQLPDLSLSVPPVQAFEASAEAVKTAQQVKGTVMPLTAAKSAVEMVKITADMKVGTSC